MNRWALQREEMLSTTWLCCRRVWTRLTAKGLIIVSVDFKKAFDSVRRGEIVEVLKEYRVDPQIIDFVVRIYEKDQTRIEIGKRDVKIDVQSGIRQGCTASTVIFKMITFKIIEQLRRGTAGIKVNSLFYADDVVLLGENEEDIRKGIEIVRRIGEEYGLKMSMRKTKCMIFNGDWWGGGGRGDEIPGSYCGKQEGHVWPAKEGNGCKG